MKYRFGPFSFDASERLLTRDGGVVSLTPKAADTLLALLEQHGRLVSKDALLERVWPGVFVEESTIAQNISTLRKVLGSGYIETLSRRGYRFTGEVTTLDESATAPESTRPSATPGARPRKRVSAAGVAAAAVLLVAVALLAWMARSNVAFSRGAGPRTLVILPFRNLQPGTAWDFLGPSLADAVSGRLSALPQLVVRPSSYAAQYGSGVVDPRRVARALDADTVLASTYVTDGQRLRVQTELVDVARGARIWQDTIDLPYEKLMTIQDRVAGHIVEALGVQMSREIRRSRALAPRDSVAYEYYLRGVALNDRHEWRPAIAVLSESVAREATNGAAWAELGVSYYGYGAFQSGGDAYVRRGLEAFRKALELSPELPEARLSLVMYQAETGELESAMTNVREILRINPNYPLAHWWLSQIQRYAGRLDESLAAGQRATQLDPYAARGYTYNTYLYMGRVDDFLRTLPDDGSARTTFYRGLGLLYKKDEQAAAIAMLDRAYQMDPDLLHARIGRAMRLGLTGDRSEGLKILSALDIASIRDGEMLYKVAQAYALLGDGAAAARVLHAAIEQDFFCVPYIESDALLDNIRGHPEYRRAAQRARARASQFG